MELTSDARFERIDATMAFVANAHAQLLTSQGLLAAEIAKLATAPTGMADALARLAEAEARLAEERTKTEQARRETQVRFDALMRLWTEWIRERRQTGGS